ncbi:hypothetical protein DTL42_00800 [Bremerella cremea]|uniref:Uncharacterized protein n=1 Tax=Bremerella cremea TaxID=1031537 RepID=A0A368KXD7_9BACT|nr:hypothetical protein DTL42_00800 [Bremerella cremea]
MRHFARILGYERPFGAKKIVAPSTRGFRPWLLTVAPLGLLGKISQTQREAISNTSENATVDFKVTAVIYLSEIHVVRRHRRQACR